MNFILYDDLKTWKNFFPLTFTRPISEIRLGILTIKDRWEKFLGKKINYIFTQPFLLKKYSVDEKLFPFENILLINSSYFPNKELIDIFFSLKDNEAVISNNNHVIAVKKKIFYYKDYKINCLTKNLKKIYEFKNVIRIQYLWDIFNKNKFFLNEDFFLLTKKKKSCSLLGNNLTLNKDKIFLESNILTNSVILNANDGPIYIEKEVNIMELTVIRGPAFIGKNTILNIGSKIYGGTTIGRNCRIGGEIINSILLSYSNKAHEGFLGNSILGEWCNLGAGTNVSNLRNDYSDVTVWNYDKNKFIPTNIQFFGIIMGDHSKSSINTQFNTATMIGVSANIFGYGLTPKYIPSFSLGGIQNNKKNKLVKIFQTADIVMKRRNKKFSELDKDILKYLYQLSY